jgi:serine/threonine protein kinase
MLLHRTVALKVLDSLPEEQEREWVKVLREARLASRLNHPHVCTVYDAGEDGGRHYIAMEYVEGLRLCDSVPKGGLDNATFMRYGVQLAGALAHAHENGVLHGDVKSANVLITSQGEVKLADFGLGRRFRREGMDNSFSSSQVLLEAGPVGGSPGYIAPEVLRGEPNSVKSDVWSLGAVLCEMATGRLPSCGEGTPAGNTAESAAGPGLSVKGVPADVARVIQRCLEEDPGSRYDSAYDVAYDLETASKYPPGEVTQKRRVRVRRILIPAAAGVAVLLALLLTVPPTRRFILHYAAAPTAHPALLQPARAPNPETKVWLNNKSGIYHCPGSVRYGKTLDGQYMRQDEALEKGGRPAFGQPCR